MSGIVGIVNFDGAPIDRALLSRMTASLDFRGPDARNIWIQDPGLSHPCAGFGHTLLRTTYEAEHEQQPSTLDGHTWIVADCRIDAREELLAQLRAKGRNASLQRPDVELILHAWHAWGEECVEHLLGDFAFAIWDTQTCRLFCARDHMGVKPFYYAHIGSTLIFSNTLDCVRMHPAVSDRLNDLAIADFLLFDLNQDPATTSFADIQRIVPAHTASWLINGLETSRYWTLPIDEPLYFKRANDYTDRFRELLDQAVSDRLRTHKIGVFMSGGLDSPALAATACQILEKGRSKSQVEAFTNIWDGFDHNERHYSSLVADRLGIPIHFRTMTDQIVDGNWDRSALHCPEIFWNPMILASDRDHLRSVSSHTRVCLYGEGPDNALLYEWKSYLRYLTAKRRFGRLAYDVTMHAVKHRRIPLLASLPRLISHRWRRRDWTLKYPTWIEAEFEMHLHLRDRWSEIEGKPSVSLHPVRPAAYASFQDLLWEVLFRDLDAGSTAASLEFRHPFIDLRLLRYMLAIPAMPWCRSKYLIRSAMRGILPQQVLRRRKSPLTSDITWEGARRSSLPPLVPAKGLSHYINASRVPATAGDDMVAFRTDFRPRALNYWLQDIEQRSDIFVHREDLEHEAVTAQT